MIRKFQFLFFFVSRQEGIWIGFMLYQPLKSIKTASLSLWFFLCCCFRCKVVLSLHSWQSCASSTTSTNLINNKDNFYWIWIAFRMSQCLFYHLIRGALSDVHFHNFSVSLELHEKDNRLWIHGFLIFIVHKGNYWDDA